jgi:hypothetical protein
MMRKRTDGREKDMVTHHIAYVGTLDEQRAGQGFVILNLAAVPAISTIAVLQSFLNITQFLHIVKM